jgi:hypothetical protein
LENFLYATKGGPLARVAARPRQPVRVDLWGRASYS